jgi:HJR/Mrr/RecB family endonuclease
MSHQEKIWEDAINLLKQDLGNQGYKKLRTYISYAEQDGGIINIYVPDDISRETIEIKYLPLIKNALSRATDNTDTVINIITEPEELVIPDNNIDMLNKQEFEEIITRIIEQMGYTIASYRGSYLLAEKLDNIIAVKPQYSTSKVKRIETEEINSALSKTEAVKAVIATNHYFSPGAQVFAQANNIILWDRDIIKRKTEELIKQK